MRTQTKKVRKCLFAPPCAQTINRRCWRRVRHYAPNSLENLAGSDGLSYAKDGGSRQILSRIQPSSFSSDVSSIRFPLSLPLSCCTGKKSEFLSPFCHPCHPQKRVQTPCTSSFCHPDTLKQQIVVRACAREAIIVARRIWQLTNRNVGKHRLNIGKLSCQEKKSAFSFAHSNLFRTFGPVHSDARTFLFAQSPIESPPRKAKRANVGQQLLADLQLTLKEACA